MQKIVALMIVLLGIGVGLALGVVLRPGPDGAVAGAGSAAERVHGKAGLAESAADLGAAASAGGKHEGTSGGDYGGDGDPEAGRDGELGSDRDYVKVGRQIIIPVVKDGETQAMMLFDLAIDVPISMTERAYSAEPRLRDAFLRELFEMSYTGAFSSTYTDERVVVEVREKLRAAARRLLGDAVDDVLILDIMRQEL